MKTWRECAEAGLSLTDAAKHLDRPITAGLKAGRNGGFQFPHGPRPIARSWEPDEDEFLRRNNGRMEPLEIAKQLDRTIGSVMSRRQALKLQGPVPGRGASAPMPSRPRGYSRAELEWARQHHRPGDKTDEAGLMLLMQREFEAGVGR